jgi:hypothetical protein
MSQFAFAEPPAVEPDLSDCMFYQTIDIPGLGEQPGQWDLRPNIKEYLGQTDFSGANVLEIGTANGFVGFEIERRGANVVSFDLAEGTTYDAPPLADEYIVKDFYTNGLRKIRNAYWLAHSRNKSKARVAYGHANHLPKELGHFDIGVIANVLQHLRDPVGALMQLAVRSNAVVVTEADWFNGFQDDLNGMIYFDKDNPFVWYQVKPSLVEAVLRRCGYTRFEKTRHTQLFVQDPEHRPGEGAVMVKIGVEIPHFTIVAYR